MLTVENALEKARLSRYHDVVDGDIPEVGLPDGIYQSLNRMKLSFINDEMINVESR